MNKPRTCPHCKIEIPIDHDFHFDKDLNLIHNQCGKIVFSVNTVGDNKLLATRQQQYPPPSLADAPVGLNCNNGICDA